MGAATENENLSIIIPAKNEAAVIADVVSAVRNIYQSAEVIVVDDGSTDETAMLAEQSGARVVRHPTSLGNGAAVKAGARAASGDILVLMDGDGQHKAKDIQSLVSMLDEGYDMAIGARDSGSHAGIGRLAANGLYNVFASMISGHRILDLTSGFRAVRADLFKRFLYLLPNGFSYPTTITMAFLRSVHTRRRLRWRFCARATRSRSCPLRQKDEQVPATSGRSGMASDLWRSSSRSRPCMLP
jgi:glycosyltransferase involved in cell wall biosynthesis